MKLSFTFYGNVKDTEVWVYDTATDELIDIEGIDKDIILRKFQIGEWTFSFVKAFSEAKEAEVIMEDFVIENE